jgi:hypothetical protein
MAGSKDLNAQVVGGGIVIRDDRGIDGSRHAGQDVFRNRGFNPLLHHVDGYLKYFVKTGAITRNQRQ